MSMIAFSPRILNFDRQLIEDLDTARGEALELEARSDPQIGRLTKIRRAIVAGASTCGAQFLAALHQSRRNRAAVEIARFRDLIDAKDSHAARLSGMFLQSGDRTARDQDAARQSSDS